MSDLDFNISLEMILSTFLAPGICVSILEDEEDRIVFSSIFMGFMTLCALIKVAFCDTCHFLF